MTVGTKKPGFVERGVKTSDVDAPKRGGTVFHVEPKSTPGIHESWVRPDGTIERNISMDLVVSAAKKSAPSP